MPRARLTARPARPARGRGATARATRARAVPAELDGRERILAVAIRLFSELGYEGTSTAAVAREAGVTQPLVHHHFGSKDGLWRVAMDQLLSSIPRFTRVPADAGGATSFLAGVESFIRFAAAHPEATRVVAREGATPSPRLDYLVDRHLGAAFRETVDLLRGAQRAGMLAADVRPELVLFLVLGAGSHLFDVTAFARRTVGIDTTASRTLEDFVALVRGVLERGLMATPARRRR